VAKHLVSQGFRVLLYDLYGRGYSDAPEVDYDSTLYVTQAALLMQYIGWDKACVAGLSMGGGITGAFAATFPHLVDGKIAVIASAGAIETRPLLARRLQSFPIVRLFHGLSRKQARKTATAESSNTPEAQAIEIVALQAALLPGFGRALASSMRYGPLRGEENSFAAIGASDMQVLLIWGTEDSTVPYRYAGVLKNLMPQALLVTLDGAEHDLTITHATEVGAALAKFFSESLFPK